MRLATAIAYESNIDHITGRQSDLSKLHDKVSSGLRVGKASDDPISAARAERAMSRITQLQSEQRALNVQRDSLAVAESTLGDAGNLLHRFRELAVRVGTATLNATDRATVANEMTAIRDQMLALANTRSSHGVYLFSGLESGQIQGVPTPAFTVTGAPPNQQYQYNGTPGQNSPTQSAVPYTLDGNATWMQVPKGNGVFDVTLGAANTGQIATDIGQFSTTPAGGSMASGYQLSFTVTGNITTYSVNTTPATTGTYVPGQPIAFTDTVAVPNVNVTLTVQGKPATGDTVDITPYSVANPANASVFELMDKLINGVGTASSTSPGLAHAVAQGLGRIDAGMDRLQSARGQAGLWLSRADTVTDANTAMDTQLETDRSNAQDLDMVRGIADQQKMQMGYQAALQSYAQIQKLSLFDYIR